MEPALSRNILTQVLEHGEKLLVSSTAASDACCRHVVVIFFSLGEFTVFGEHEFIRALEELHTLFRSRYQTIRFNVLMDKMQDYSLMDDGIPEPYGMVLSRSEKFKLVVFV